MNLILDLLFPKRCVGCGKFDTYFCKLCIANILQTDLICPICFEISSGGQTHLDCKEKFGLDGLWSLGLYKDPLKTAIKSLKYKYVLDLAESLVDIMVKYFDKYQPLFLGQLIKDKGKGWIVTAVPLHWFRENCRGFNQPAEIGKLLAKKLNLKFIEILKKVKHTKSQVGLKVIDREENIKNAFSLDSKFLTLDSNVLLIDDVWTTGSTIKECCLVLKQAGLKKVWAITLAR